MTEEDYEALKDIVQGDVEMAKLLHAEPYSESDVRDLMERLEIDQTTAIVLALAQRAKVFCTVDTDYRRLAKVLEIDVVNRAGVSCAGSRSVRSPRRPPDPTGSDGERVAGIRTWRAGRLWASLLTHADFRLRRCTRYLTRGATGTYSVRCNICYMRTDQRTAASLKKEVLDSRRRPPGWSRHEDPTGRTSPAPFDSASWGA